LGGRRGYAHLCRASLDGDARSHTAPRIRPGRRGLARSPTLLIAGTPRPGCPAVNASIRHAWCSVFRCPLVAGFGCPPRICHHRDRIACGDPYPKHGERGRATHCIQFLESGWPRCVVLFGNDGYGTSIPNQIKLCYLSRSSLPIVCRLRVVPSTRLIINSPPMLVLRISIAAATASICVL